MPGLFKTRVCVIQLYVWQYMIMCCKLVFLSPDILNKQNHIYCSKSYMLPHSLCPISALAHPKWHLPENMRANEITQSLSLDGPGRSSRSTCAALRDSIPAHCVCGCRRAWCEETDKRSTLALFHLMIVTARHTEAYTGSCEKAEHLNPMMQMM